MTTGKIFGINGPIIYIEGNTNFKMSEMVYVGKEKLVGEVIGLTSKQTTIQVFEDNFWPKTWRRGCFYRRCYFCYPGSWYYHKYF